MKGELKMIRHYFRRTFILSLVFGMTIFLLPGGVFAQDVAVAVDIKPGSCPNPMNVKSRGVLPVAILGVPYVDEANLGFEVSTIDTASIRLLVGGTEVAPIRSSFEDVAAPYTGGIPEEPTCEECSESEPDGIMDLTLKFRTQDIVAALSADIEGGTIIDGSCIVLELTGFLTDSTPITGQDVVRILKKGKVKPPKPPNPHKPPKD